ncbi:MAG TPA: hypothetical protein VEA41_06815 [Salinarimonas sp.]|nr:hypothetical protein [Salinarimonas sp.]
MSTPRARSRRAAHLLALGGALVVVPAQAAWLLNRTELSPRTAVGEVLYAPANTDERFTGIGLFCNGRQPTFYVYGADMPSPLAFQIEVDGRRETLRLARAGDAHWMAPVARDFGPRLASARTVRGSSDGGVRWNGIDMAGARSVVTRALSACG